LSQNKTETARQYLWRLNAATNEAGIALIGPTAVERHVNRFVNSLRDTTVKTMLTAEAFESVAGLEKKLRLHENRTRPSQHGESD